ncbi:hypothetical protein E4U55_007286 [Claviceps digitariae]|nr:hypothetical protein E4U55_007286 [Claviceps digitariae]
MGASQRASGQTAKDELSLSDGLAVLRQFALPTCFCPSVHLLPPYRPRKVDYLTTPRIFSILSVFVVDFFITFTHAAPWSHSRPIAAQPSAQALASVCCQSAVLAASAASVLLWSLNCALVPVALHLLAAFTPDLSLVRAIINLTAPLSRFWTVRVLG